MSGNVSKREYRLLNPKFWRPAGWTLAALALAWGVAARITHPETAFSRNVQVSASGAPTDAELHARAQMVLENQHRDDDALDAYERVEHQVDRTNGAAPRVLEDKWYRIVPTGTGNLKILLREGGRDVDPAAYRQQLLAWRDVLELMLKQDDPRTKAAYAKAQKKKQDRAELVAATREAYLLKWLGRENLYGHECDVLDLTPNPDFHPKSIYQDAMTRVTAKIWIDRASLQMMRGEAHVTKDISIGAGILGKLYRGGVFYLDQSEVAPGIWLPSRYQFDFSGRKFLFSFEEHQYIEATQYRYDGPPRQALVVAQNDLASGKMLTAGQ
jgi:hypothetical protein